MAEESLGLQGTRAAAAVELIDARDARTAAKNLSRWITLWTVTGTIAELSLVGLYLAGESGGFFRPTAPAVVAFATVVIIFVGAAPAFYGWWAGYAKSVEVSDLGVTVALFSGRMDFIPWSEFTQKVIRGDWVSFLGYRLYVQVYAPWGVRALTLTPRMARSLLSDPRTSQWPVPAALRNEVARWTQSPPTSA